MTQTPVLPDKLAYQSPKKPLIQRAFINALKVAGVLFSAFFASWLYAVGAIALFGSDVVSDSLFSLFSFLPLTAGLLISARFLVGYRLKDLWLSSQKSCRHSKFFAIGCITGFLAVGLLWSFFFSLGAYQITSVQFTPLVLIYLIGFLVQSSGEEIAIRGILTRAFINTIPATKAKLIIILIVPNLLFSSLHIVNAGATLISSINTVLFGILFSLLVLTYANLPLACGFHAAWNFSLGVLFGTPVSGHVLPSTMMTLNITHNELIGGIYGFENTWAALAIVLSAIGLLIYKNIRNPELLARSLQPSKAPSKRK